LIGRTKTKFSRGARHMNGSASNPEFWVSHSTPIRGRGKDYIAGEEAFQDLKED